MSSEQDNVIPLDPDVREPWLEREIQKRDRCRHIRVVVSAEERRVYCRACGADLDPIAVLLEIAHRERQLYHSRRDVAKARKQLAMLKDDEKKTKARLKRARERLAELGGGEERVEG